MGALLVFYALFFCFGFLLTSNPTSTTASRATTPTIGSVRSFVVAGFGVAVGCVVGEVVGAGVFVGVVVGVTVGVAVGDVVGDGVVVGEGVGVGVVVGSVWFVFENTTLMSCVLKWVVKVM